MLSERLDVRAIAGPRRQPGGAVLDRVEVGQPGQGPRLIGTSRGDGFADAADRHVERAGDQELSETTVTTHVARVLMKLGLRDRVQEAVLAYEAGIVTPGAQA